MKVSTKLFREITISSAGFLVVRFVSGVLALAALILLTRSLGPAEYGVYSYAVSVIALIVTFSQLGLPTLVLRETAKANDWVGWATARGLWYWSLQVALGLGFVLVFALLSFRLWVSESSTDYLALSWVVFLIPLVTVALSNRLAILRGLNLVVAAPLLQHTLPTATVVFGVMITVTIFSTENLTAERVLLLELFGVALALLCSLAYLRWRGRPRIVMTDKVLYARRAWIAAAMPLALIVGLRTVNLNIDVIFLGWFAPPDEIGLYRVATRVSTIALLGQEIVIFVMSAYLARLYSEGSKEELESLATRASKMSFIIATSAILVFVFYGDQLLALFFGQEFVPALTAIIVITVGYACSVGLGAVSTILNMCGHERRTAIGAIMSALFNIILNLILIPKYGMLGAAISTAFSLFFLHLMLWFYVKSLVGIRPDIFG